MQKPRCLIIFEESIKSTETKKAYFYALEKFRKWTNLENYDDLLEVDEKSIQRLRENPESIIAQFSSKSRYFIANCLEGCDGEVSLISKMPSLLSQNHKHSQGYQHPNLLD